MPSFNIPDAWASWLAAGVAAVGAYLVLALLLRIARRVVRSDASGTWSVRSLVYGLLKGVRVTSLLLIAALAGMTVFVSMTVAKNPAEATDVTIAWTWLWRISVIVIAIQLVSWAGTLVAWGGALWIRRNRSEDGVPDPALVGAMGTFRWVVLTIVYAAILLLALENLGVDVTALIAGLGVGGIAVALAVQNVLGDLFGSLTITLDKPFVVGDFVVVGNEMGTIEKIGLKTTRVRSLGGEQLIFGNNDLLSSRIRNYKRMQERRIVFSFGLTYQTTPDQIEEVVAGVKRIIGSTEKARFDRCHFSKFGASSLDFEVVYYVLSAEYGVYMDVQQSINLDLIRLVESIGGDFAYPTQTLYMKREEPSRVEA